MSRVLFCTLLALLLAPLGGLRAQTLQLVDGQVLLATVEYADGEGLRVHRLDNGGSLELSWEHLSPECALRIKQAQGLVAEDQGEPTVKVHEVHYLLDGTTVTAIGKIVSGMEGPLVVQQKGLQLRIPRANVSSVRPIEVPVTQVFTRDEFYAQQLLEKDPGDRADDHLQLAELLIKIRDYDHAKQHLDKAKELGNSRDPQRLTQTIARLERYRESQKERELLDQIQIARARGTAADLERGQKLIEQFQKDFPQTKLKAEFEAEQRTFTKARQRFLSQKVAEDWRRMVRSLAEKKALEPGLTLQAAREYAERTMSDEIAQAVAQRAKLPVAEVKELFGMRKQFPVGRRTELFSYGIGSWLLGEAAVIKDTKTGKAQEEEPKDAAAERELDRIARAIRKAMEARRQAVQGKGGQVQEQTEDEFWAEASASQKANWMRAYYAEFGGALEVTGAYVQPCVTCFGTGENSEAGPNGKIVKVKCFLCHGTKYVRSVRAF